MLRAVWKGRCKVNTAAIMEAWKPLFEKIQEATRKDYLSIELTVNQSDGKRTAAAKVYVPGPISWTGGFPTVEEAVESVLQPDRFALEAQRQKVSAELAKLQSQAKEIEVKLAEVLEKELAEPTDVQLTEGAVK